MFGGSAPSSGCFQMEFPYPTDYRVSLVSVSESGSYKYLVLEIENENLVNRKNNRNQIIVFTCVSEICVSFGIKWKYGHF